MEDTIKLNDDYWDYWDCECEHNYIHPASTTKCGICKAEAEDQPDSIQSEVEAFLKKQTNPVVDG